MEAELSGSSMEYSTEMESTSDSDVIVLSSEGELRITLKFCYKRNSIRNHLYILYIIYIYIRGVESRGYFIR